MLTFTIFSLLFISVQLFIYLSHCRGPGTPSKWFQILLGSKQNKKKNKKKGEIWLWVMVFFFQLKTITFFQRNIIQQESL